MAVLVNRHISVMVKLYVFLFCSNTFLQIIALVIYRNILLCIFLKDVDVAFD